MKKRNLFKKILSVAAASCLLLSAIAGAMITASASSETIPIEASSTSVISTEQGVRLCYTDFETKTVDITGFESKLLSSADMDVEDEKWINANPFGGYIHMAGYPDKPTRTVIRFNGENGVKLGKGKITVTYKVAAKEPTKATLFGLSDKITYSNKTEATVDHVDDCKTILNAEGGWVNITSTFEIPEGAASLLSYEIDYHASCYHYIDDVTVWYFPESSFITDKEGALSMTIVSGESYTFPKVTGIAGWVCDGKVYRSNDTVSVDEIAQKKLIALEKIDMIDADKITFAYEYENDRAGNADGTMTVSFGGLVRRDIKLVELVWGYGNDTDGYAPLADYTPLKSASGVDFPLTYTLNKDLAVPPEANALPLAVTDDITTHYIAAPVPEHKLHPAGEPL